MKNIILLVIISFTVQDTFKLLNEKKGQYTSVSTDDFGNIYVTNKNKNLLKFSGNLDSLYTFESKNLEVDIIAPQHALKILVVDKNLNTALFLDKTLSPTTDEISLNELELPSVEAISMSRDNNIWIFDTDAQELKKYDIQFEQISTSGNLSNLLDENWYPYLLKELGDKIYLADSLKGIMEFDFYGSYLRTLPFKTTNNFNIINNNLLCIINDTLVIQDLLLPEQKKIPLPVKDIIDFDYSKQHILLLTEEKLHIYQLPL